MHALEIDPMFGLHIFGRIPFKYGLFILGIMQEIRSLESYIIG